MIKERALDLHSYVTDMEVKDIIRSLGWTEFYKKPDEGILQLVKEFYTNVDKRVNDKVSVRGKWINMLNERSNKLIGAPDQEDDKYFVLMDEGVETT